MKRINNIWVMIVMASASAACVASACVCSSPAVQAKAVQSVQTPEAGRPEFYVAKVRPLLDANCGRCHEALNRRGGLNMETRDGLLKGGHHGAAMVPGDAANSLMLRLINHAGPVDDPMNMPPNKPKLSDADIKVIEEWIKAGAVMPSTAQ